MNEDYPRKPFRIHSPDTLCDVMRTYPLATLLSGTAGSATITLVPMLVDMNSRNDIVLTGHIDSNNKHAKLLLQGSPVSFQFLGPDSYASPDLYADPHLPGWLYVSVQGDGELSEILDGELMRSELVRSARTFGAANQSFSLDLQDPRVLQFLPYIHGFRISVKRISGIAKLAQDKGPVNSNIAMKFVANQDNAGSRRLFRRLLQESGIPT